MGRYINSNEAAWRILNFPIHERYPTVIHLSVHLKKRQESTSQKNQVTDAIGRVYTVHPSNSECFHLRLLLNEVPGPTSFQYIKTIEGKICSNYKEACQVRGLLENDKHWNATLEEATFVHSPRMLRDLFGVILQVCAISNPNQLWITHRERLSEDILHPRRFRLPKESVAELTLLIEDKLESKTPCNNGLNPVEQVLIVLRFYAVACMQLAIADLFDVNQPTVCRVMHRVSEAIASLLPHFIYLPVNKEECKTVSRKFFSIAGFPKVIGALDGTFVRIMSPSGEDAERCSAVGKTTLH
ncbi:ATP-dependent DNA helicase [Trichonephila clavipes]|nr:ATP-dependent DNA helicase [Trichonephila clavipes]